jgi:phosphotriesterase-related protein
LGRLLLSHDNGWYTVGEPGGGSFASYTSLFTDLIPALRTAGMSESEVQQLLIRNPADAFAIRSRTTD